MEGRGEAGKKEDPGRLLVPKLPGADRPLAGGQGAFRAARSTTGKANNSSGPVLPVAQVRAPGLLPQTPEAGEICVPVLQMRETKARINQWFSCRIPEVQGSNPDLYKRPPHTGHNG